MKIKGTLKIGDTNLHIDIDTLEEVYVTNISPSYTKDLKSAVETFKSINFFEQKQESPPPVADPSSEEFITEAGVDKECQFEDDEDSNVCRS